SPRSGSPRWSRSGGRSPRAPAAAPPPPRPRVFAASPDAALPLQPAAVESGALEPAPDHRVLTQRPPHQTAPIVLDHGDDRALIDPQLIVVEPAHPRRHAPLGDRYVDVQRRIERVHEAVTVEGA